MAGERGLLVTGMLGSPLTDQVLRDRISGSPAEAAVLGVELANRESHSSWREFLLQLKQRGLTGVEFVVSDDHSGLKKAIAEVLPEAASALEVAADAAPVFESPITGDGLVAKMTAAASMQTRPWATDSGAQVRRMSESTALDMFSFSFEGANRLARPADALEPGRLHPL